MLNDSNNLLLVRIQNDDPCSNTICASEVNESHYAEENVDPQVIFIHINDACGGLKRRSLMQEVMLLTIYTNFRGAGYVNYGFNYNRLYS